MPYRILVADDHSSSRAALAALLEQCGFVIDVAEDGRQALSLMQRQAFDLSLLDMHMPLLTGLQVLSQIQAFGLDVPSILMTGHPTRAMEAAALEAGALAFLRKPIPGEVLKVTLERFLVTGPGGGTGPSGDGGPPPHFPPNGPGRRA